MIEKNLSLVLNQIPNHVQLVAVSKTKPSSMIVEAYHAGQRHFGENKALELRDKAQELNGDIQWHFIGHLQRNKVKYIVPHTTLIHSIDSLRLLKEVNKEAAKHQKVVACLLQFHIAKESTKFGFSLEEVEQLIAEKTLAELPYVNIVGVMGMATFTTDQEQVREEFKMLHSIFTTLKAKHFSDKIDFKEISMGMSGDYLIAIEEGATIVRVGSSIFGSRG
jgi:pyridoxal phosphate enzyme (YggS family)